MHSLFAKMLDHFSETWLKVSGPSFEEIKFSCSNNERRFTSWLHHQPEMTGVWEFNDHIIHIKHNNEEKLEFFLKIRKLNEISLSFTDADDGAESIFKKLP